MSGYLAPTLGFAPSGQLVRVGRVGVLLYSLIAVTSVMPFHGHGLYFYICTRIF